MFNFTTQTIFNTIVVTPDNNSQPVKGANVIKGGTGKKPAVRIGNLRFDAADVLDIQKKVATDEHLAKVDFSIDKLIELVTANSADVQEGNYRIVLYLGLSMSSQDSLYANALLYKGKPLFIEFPVGANDTAEEIGARIVKIAKKYCLLTVGEKLMNISTETETSGSGVEETSSTTVTFEAVSGYQQIRKALLQKYDPNADKIDCCGATGDYKTIITGVPTAYEFNAGTFVDSEKVLEEDGTLRELADNEVGIQPGIEAFCDYNWIIHNLRLPTATNTNFWAVTKPEQPVVGGKYNQYIIRLKKERDGIMGEIVGARGVSVTTHVLYVLQSQAAALETVLATLHAISTDADDVLEDP